MNVVCVVTPVVDAPSLVVGRFGRDPDLVAVSCSRCGQCVTGPNTDRSVRRLAVRLRDTCPRRERNFYQVPTEREPYVGSGGTLFAPDS